jgi:hypothetical protein
MTSGYTQLNNQYDFFTYHDTTRYKFFNDLNSTYPDVWDETTFYQNISDPRIYDAYTFGRFAAEFLPSGGTPTPPTPPASGTTEANAYLSAVVSAGGTVDSTMSAATRAFFVSLFAEDLWDSLYAFYPVIGGTAGAHKFNGKNPADTNGAFRLTFNGGITHSADGFQPNGTNGYAETYFNASTQIGDGNSVSLGLYINLEGVDSGVFNIGVIDGSDNSLILCPKTSGSPYLIFDSGTLPDARTEFNPIDSISGITIGTCRSATEREIYKNGVSLATNTNNISPTYANATIPIGARYSTVDGFQFYVNNRFAFVFISSGLTDSEVSTLSTAINTYQAALGRYSY